MRCKAARISTITPRRSSSDFCNELFLLVERRQARLRRVDIGFDVADARRGVDQLLIELAAVRAQRLDLAPQLGLAFRRIALTRARGVEFLIVLFEHARRRSLLARRPVLDA